MYKGLLDNNLLDNRIEEVDIWSIGIITYDNRTTTKKHTTGKKQEINNDKKKNSTNYFKLYKQEKGNKGSTTRGEQQDSETHTV